MSDDRIISISQPRAYFAPIPEVGEPQVWQPLGTVVGISMEITPDLDPFQLPGSLAGGFSFTFIGTPNLRRLWKIMIRRTPAELRRSAMRSEYHRRQKRRNRR